MVILAHRHEELASTSSRVGVHRAAVDEEGSCRQTVSHQHIVVVVFLHIAAPLDLLALQAADRQHNGQKIQSDEHILFYFIKSNKRIIWLKGLML